MADLMDFGDAVKALKMGFRVARDGWNGKDMWLTYISPDIAGCATEYVTSTKPLEALPWIGMKTADDKFVPWLASQTDVLSQDWGIV